MDSHELNVLVVEDDAFQRKMYASMLSTLGVGSVRTVGDGEEGLGIIREEGARSIDMALCDLDMPGMDGLEFLRHLGQEHHGVAVIIISALDSKLLASVAKMARMYGIELLGVIKKPITLVQLQELVAKYGAAGNREIPAASHSFTLEQILQGIRENQFEPFFHPKVDLKTGRLTGAEALARWIHPELGVIGPCDFILPLEQSGNIDGLTLLMLEKAAIACRALRERGKPLSISVNLSMVSLVDSMVADRIIRLVRDAGAEPCHIILEITESAVVTEVAQALENLSRLYISGFALSIDDYGTGYSSIQQLTRIPFSELKIDQSFVKDFAQNRLLRIVVESSLDMARKLQLRSVAEGVETQQDWDMLKSLGCDMVQGHFIAKPMDMNAFQDFVDHYDRIH